MKKKIMRILAVLVFLCGLAIFLFPYIMDRYTTYENDKIIEQFSKDVERLREQDEQSLDDSHEAAENSGENGGTDGESVLDKLYSDMLEYNQHIYQNGQSDLKDPFSYEMPSFDLTEYGFESNVIGVISIPKMDVTMPMYLGATKENMSHGAVVLGQTSMPIGGVNTNVVIAAHRGYRGIKMFRNIQQMEIGDKIYITTPWDELEYEVCDTQIVWPYEIEKIYIQEGEDMVTLLTCHPYTKNTNRYLVFAKRVNGEGVVQNQTSQDDTAGENQNESDGKTEDNTQADDSVPDTPDNTEHETIEITDDMQDSQDRINLETYLPIVGIVLVIIAVMIGLLATGRKKEGKDEN